MYEQNGNTKVTIVVHSMGGPVSLYFLTSVVTQEWKDTYIDSYIPLAAAWNGGNGLLPFLLTGQLTNDPESLEMLLGVSDLRFLYRTYASLYFLLPRASVWNDTILIVTPTQNYTANDYQQLFADAGYPQGYTQFNSINFGIELPAPNVSTYCFYGLGFPTPIKFIYGSDFPNAQPTIINGDGDYSVNKEGLEVCLRWANGNYPFNRTVFQDIDHSAIVVDKLVLQTIGSIVGAPVDPINGAPPLAILKLQYILMLLFMIMFIVN